VNQLLRLAAVAEQLDCSHMTVRRLIARGELTAVRVGRALRVTEESLAQFVRRGGQRVAS
jgi:excisionase family DNA binding protein